MDAISRYCAFISYSHEDARWATWLQRRIEGYRLPRHLRATTARGPRADRLGSCFRDRSDLAAAGNLSARIEAALADAAAMILVCSPQAAASPWVNQEVAAFRRLHGIERIFCLIVAGEPGAGDDCDCFPPSLRNADADGGQAADPVAADVRPGKDGKALALQKLLAGLLGVNLDELRRREAQRRARRLSVIAAAAVAGMALTLGLSIFALVARDDAERRQAQAEDLLGFMQGDLHRKLEKVGRLDLLDAVADKSTAYFATLEPRDLTDTTLEQQAKALTQMGQVRIEQGDHDQALVALDQAHARASELVARAPRDAGRRFLLAQVQAHTGGVAWAQGRYDDAGGWLRAYRDSALHLAALEPGNFDYQREVADGHHNLAVLDQSLGRDAEAERAFRAELALYRQWMRAYPADSGLRSRAANVASFLGSLAARQGRLREAVRFFDEDVRAIRRNLQAEPTDAASQAELVEELVFLAQTQATLGQLQDARASLLEANALADRLSRQDPDNAGWRNAVGYSRWWRSAVEAGTDPHAAMTDALAAEAVFARSHAAAPKDQNSLSWLAKSRLQLAQLALRSGRIATARDWLARTRALFAIPPSGDALHGMQAEVSLLEGDLRAQEGDREAARRAWLEAERLLLAGSDGPVPFERLEALARAQLALGKHISAAAHLQRLDAAGVPRSSRPQVAAVPAETSARSR